MYKKLIFAATFMFAVGLTKTIAQDSSISTGGDISSSDGTISFTVGQVVYTINNSSYGSAVQGLQQPYEISIYSDVSEIDVDLETLAYPNPVSSDLILKVYDINKEQNLKYQLFDIHGRLIAEQDIQENETKIDMLYLNGGAYFLKIIKKNSTLKTFKIIKK